MLMSYSKVLTLGCIPWHLGHFWVASQSELREYRLILIMAIEKHN